MKNMLIIEPDHKLKIIWDFFIIFFYIILFFTAALHISFGLFMVEIIFPYSPILQKTVQILFNIVLFSDLFLKCFTAYYQNGILIRKPEKIFRNYLKSHFLYDFLAIIPIFLDSYRILLIDDSEETSKTYTLLMKLSQLLIYFKTTEVTKALEILDDILQLEERSQAFFNLVKLIIEILLFSHFIACSWHAVGSYSPYHENILEVEDLLHKQWFSRYLTFLFWTISWEKLEPKNELEYGFGFFAVLCSHAVFGFIIEGIHEIVSSLGEKNIEMKHDIRVINKFFGDKNIGYDLQAKIRKYLYFMHENNAAKGLVESQVIGKLSNSLKEEVLYKANSEILQMFPLFSKNFSQNTIKDLVLSMKKVRFYPEEVIYKVFLLRDLSCFFYYYFIKARRI